MENNTTRICEVCGGEIHIEATRCKHCQAWILPEMKPKNFLETALICWFLGQLGIHRFYTGYIGIGLVQLFTFGGCGIWSLIDFICILLNNYKDANGNLLAKYDRSTAKVIMIVILALIALTLFFIFGSFFLMLLLAMSVPE